MSSCIQIPDYIPILKSKHSLVSNNAVEDNSSKKLNTNLFELSSSLKEQILSSILNETEHQETYKRNNSKIFDQSDLYPLCTAMSQEALSFEGRYKILLSQLTNDDLALFIERYGDWLRRDDFRKICEEIGFDQDSGRFYANTKSLSSNIQSNYELQFYLKKYFDFFNLKFSANKELKNKNKPLNINGRVKNRRFAKMKQLDSQGYFDLSSIKARNPQIYNDYFNVKSINNDKQNLKIKDEEKDILFDRLKEVNTIIKNGKSSSNSPQFKYNKNINMLNNIKSDSTINISSSSINSKFKTDGLQSNSTSTCNSVTDNAKVLKTSPNSLLNRENFLEEKGEAKGFELQRQMREAFLSGEDCSIDYKEIDSNVDLDEFNLVELDNDAQDDYFFGFD